MNDDTVTSRSDGTVAEIRTYRIKPGRREEFIRYFVTRVAPLLRSKGIAIVGPFRDIADADTIVWLRVFPSLDDRERMLKAFYESDEWQRGQKDDTTAMIESQSHALLVLPRWMVSDPTSV
jgi:heme-degrading monooxygenase HmoA